MVLQLLNASWIGNWSIAKAVKRALCQMSCVDDFKPEPGDYHLCYQRMPDIVGAFDQLTSQLLKALMIVSGLFVYRVKSAHEQIRGLSMFPVRAGIFPQ